MKLYILETRFRSYMGVNECFISFSALKAHLEDMVLRDFLFENESGRKSLGDKIRGDFFYGIYGETLDIRLEVWALNDESFINRDSSTTGQIALDRQTLLRLRGAFIASARVILENRFTKGLILGTIQTMYDEMPPEAKEQTAFDRTPMMEALRSLLPLYQPSPPISAEPLSPVQLQNMFEASAYAPDDSNEPDPEPLNVNNVRRIDRAVLQSEAEPAAPIPVAIAVPSVQPDRQVVIVRLHHTDRGRWVRYTANAGATASYGRIKHWQGNFVFVVFHCGGDWERYFNYTGEACTPAQLEFRIPGINEIARF